ncbi:MAG: galactitol-1-phosphate 5-dehydrogenase [Fusicatenibacter sp.]|nr:galactitol-1-phosphate 5-dehydrogenase [Lachnospiraceae bacterium]MDY2939106.1 galactitol-1-phosphate 5-dehydrogenase [Fusicatenibacter sp.]
MKAYQLRGIGDLVREETEKPALKPGWVLVQVKAAGICSSDIPRIFQNGTYHFPTIPGHEFSGIVVETADPQDRELLGKRVGVFPLIPCRKCGACQKKQYELCEYYDYLGSRRDGGFAEYAAVPAWNLVELPENVSYRKAAMLEPLSVALHAVKRGEIRSGDTVAVIGSGMIGFAAAQWAKSMGAKSVCVIGRSEEKKKIADRIPGISYLIQKEMEELPLFDCVIEAVGSKEAVETALSIVNPGGRVVLMGNPKSDISLKQAVYWRILRKQISVTGTWNSSYEKDAKCDWSEAVEAMASGEIDVACLISHCYPAERLMEGLELMRTKQEPYCKVMIEWDQEEEKGLR